MATQVRKKTQWTVVHSPVANTIATATKAALARARHYITGFSLSFKGGTPAVATAEVRSGATVLDRIELPAAVWAPIVVNYVHPLECGINVVAEVNLPALGAGITGTAVVKGFTVFE